MGRCLLYHAVYFLFTFWIWDLFFPPLPNTCGSGLPRVHLRKAAGGSEATTTEGRTHVHTRTPGMAGKHVGRPLLRERESKHRCRESGRCLLFGEKQAELWYKEAEGCHILLPGPRWFRGRGKAHRHAWADTKSAEGPHSAAGWRKKHPRGSTGFRACVWGSRPGSKKGRIKNMITCTDEVIKAHW